MSVIPDSIEPVEAFRCWTLEKGELKSLNGGGVGETWTPGEPLHARCNAGNDGTTHIWNVVRRGRSLEEANQYTAHMNQAYSSMWAMGRSAISYPYPAQIELPDGYGFELEAVTHEAPGEACTCGIYAAKNADGVPNTGNVYGKVKLWGKVVPGSDGYRAEWAYPSEFRVPASLEKNAKLAAFGVPIVVDETVVEQQALLPATSKFIARTRGQSWLKVAIAVNLASAGVNLTLLGVHLLV